MSGADAHSLQKGDGNALVDYGEAVKLYVEKMAKGGKAGETTLGMDIPGFGAEGTHVTVSADFFENPEVAAALKSTLFIFKD